MLFFKVVVLSFLTFGFSSAADCPKAVPQIDFNVTAVSFRFSYDYLHRFLNQYAGVWYEAYRHDINEEGYTCTNETLIANPNGTFTVWLQDVSQSAGYHSRHGSAEAAIPGEPAAIIMNVDNPSNAFRFCLTTYESIFLLNRRDN